MGFDFSAAYDELKPSDDDYRFYDSLAAELGVTRAVDLGCGTGVLARLWAMQGIEVIGVDPDADMIRTARSRDPQAMVEWNIGYANDLPSDWADLTVMTGHVAQVFRQDDDWKEALHHIHRALRAGGVLSFETRDPIARKWESWTRDQTLRTVDTPDGQVEFWHETATVDLPLVAYDTLTRNLVTGQLTTSRDVLSFRGHEEVQASLENAGFATHAVYGAWDRGVPTESTHELIFIARKMHP